MSSVVETSSTQLSWPFHRIHTLALKTFLRIYFLPNGATAAMACHHWYRRTQDRQAFEALSKAATLAEKSCDRGSLRFGP